MRRYFSLLIFLISIGTMQAQESGNTSDTIPKTTPPKVIPQDTIKTEEVLPDSIPPTKPPKVAPSDTVKSKSNEKKEVNNDEVAEPKIIYYQSVGGGDNWNNKRVRRKEKYRNRNDIHTLTGRSRHGGGFGALSFKSTELLDESIVMAGLRGGWIINRTLAIGFEGYGIIPTATIQEVAGNDVMPLGGYGGLFLELIFFSNQVIHVTFPVSGGAGWLGYYEDNGNNLSNFDGNPLSDDVFWYVEPGVSLEINIARNFRLAGGVSKRFTQDLVLPGTEDEDFNTLSYFITLKIGSF